MGNSGRRRHQDKEREQTEKRAMKLKARQERRQAKRDQDEHVQGAEEKAT